jgi:hypothetical protein
MATEVSELEYLRFVYNSLSQKETVSIYKKFSGLPPEEYILLLCKDCQKDVGKYSCLLCDKLVCLDCIYVCEKMQLLLCKEHFLPCPICQRGCVCPLCRKFSTEYTCNVCSENYEISYSCGCNFPEDENCVTGITCIICFEEIHPITKERLDLTDDTLSCL